MGDMRTGSPSPSRKTSGYRQVTGQLHERRLRNEVPQVRKNLLESNEDLLQRGLSFEKLSTRVTHPGASQHGPRSSDEAAARSREAARGNVDEKEEARRTENALGCLGSLK